MEKEADDKFKETGEKQESPVDYLKPFIGNEMEYNYLNLCMGLANENALLARKYYETWTLLEVIKYNAVKQARNYIKYKDKE